MGCWHPHLCTPGALGGIVCNSKRIRFGSPISWRRPWSNSFKHIVPNILSPISVQATLGLANAILTAAARGFLGLGAIPPQPEWGAMLGDSYKYLSSGAWWAVLFPGLAIMFSVLGFNLLGDGLRDALDPKMRV